MEDKANLIEVFSAIQGEGPYVGFRHLFVRFFGCHLDCIYCDTPSTLQKKRFCQIEHTPGTRNFKDIKNPVSLNDLAFYITTNLKEDKLHKGISFTGGEPLLHSNFIKSLCSVLKNNCVHQPFYLETSGDLFKNLQDVIEWIDIISMDIKVPSSTSQKSNWEAFQKFIAIANQKECFVKVVVSSQFTDEELKTVGEIVAGEDQNIDIILQPLTPYGQATDTPKPDQVLRWQAMFLNYVNKVRVIPQTHKMISQL